MARQYRTGLIITGDASGGIRAVRATEKELGQLNRGFERGSRRSRDFARNVGGTSRELQVLRRGASIAATALAGVFAARSLQGQIDFADELQKTNLRIGASTEALSQYNYVASQSGVQFGQLTTAWQRQTRRIAQATQGTGEAVKALKALRLSATELNQLQPEEQFERIAAAMQGVENQGQRTALAMQLWDTEGVSLLQIVNQGTDAIAAMRAEADRLGLTISQQTANNMAAFTSEIDRVKFAAQGLTTTMLADLVPAMTEGLQTTNAWVEQLGGAEVILERVAMVAGTLATVYLAHRLGPALNAAGATGLRAGRTIAEGMYIATGATGRLNQALVVAQGRIVAVSAAGRALRGTLALLGGPAGVAMIAAGAMYHFREELGLVRPPLEASTQRVAELTANLDNMNRAGLELRLSTLVGQLAELQAQAEATGEAYLEVGRTDAARSGGGFLGVDVSGQVQQIQEIGQAAEGTRQEFTDVEAAIDIVKKRLEALGNPARPTGGALRGLSDEAAKAAEQLKKAYESTEAQLRKQIELFGVTSEVAKLRYEIEHGNLKGLAPDRAQHLLSMQEELALMQDQHRITNQYLPELEKLQQLKRDAASIDALGGNLGNLAAKQLEQQLAGVASQGLTVPTSLHATVSGPMGEADRLDREMAQYQQQYEQRLALLREFTNEEYGIRAEAQAAIEALEQQHQDAIQQYEHQSQQARMQGYAGMFGNLANLSATFAGDSAGITKGLIAFEQAANLATTISNMAAAQSQAAASAPFPANLANMAAVAAQGAALASTISSIVSPPEPSFSASSYSISGQAHAGIDSIPREGTWLLDRGERVVDNRTNQDLKQYLERENRQAALQTGGGGLTIHAPVTVQAQQGVSEQDAARQGYALGRAFEAEIVRVLQKHQRPGGVLSTRKG